MSFSVNRSGGMLVFDAKYNGRRKPTDVHIHLGSTSGPALIGYDRIPQEIDPTKGLKLELSNANPQLPRGRDGKVLIGTWFTLRWTFSDGGSDETDEELAEVQVTAEEMGEAVLRFLRWLLNPPR
jgi:hypothetical protein